jgi:hypothetical protein
VIPTITFDISSSSQLLLNAETLSFYVFLKAHILNYININEKELKRTGQTITTSLKMPNAVGLNL